MPEPEKKSMFPQMCNRLREYAKEKSSSMVDLTLATPLSHASLIDIEKLPSPTPSVMNLFPTESYMSENMPMSRRYTSPHQQVGLGLISLAEDKTYIGDYSNVNSFAGTGSRKGAQMTIVYKGKVMVYDDIAADRAKEIICIADEGRFTAPYTFAFCPFANSNSETNCNPSPKSISSPHGHIFFDLPIKRKASLTQFFEKRKDRIRARASAYSASKSITND